MTVLVSAKHREWTSNYLKLEHKSNAVGRFLGARRSRMLG